jgi:hypothetical protein
MTRVTLGEGNPMVTQEDCDLVQRLGDEVQKSQLLRMLVLSE